jgi:hypothetical protein
VPYLARLQRAAPGVYTPEFQSYLGGGDFGHLTSTATGDIIAVLTHPREDYYVVNLFQSEIVVVRIGR